MAVFQGQKICYLEFEHAPKLSILAHMLLYKSYINVAIAVILLYSKILYDHPELR